MKIKGRYIIDGESYDNLITNQASPAILSYLAGLAPDWSGMIAVGTGSSAPTTGDTELSFELHRSIVSARSVDESTGEVVIKSSLPTNLIADLYEVGVYSLASTDLLQVGYIITDFDKDSFDITNTTVETINSRVGSAAAKASPSASTTATCVLSGVLENFGQTDYSDLFKLAYEPLDANANTIEVRLVNSSGDYFTYTITAGSAGYKVASWTRLDMTKSGAISWDDDIVSISFLVSATAGGTANVVLDGLRTSSTGSENSTKLISRALLSPAKTKEGIDEMDIEYRIQFNI